MAKTRAQPRHRRPPQIKVGQKYADPENTVKGVDQFTALVVTAVHTDGRVDLATTSIEDGRTWKHIDPTKLVRVG